MRTRPLIVIAMLSVSCSSAPVHSTVDPDEVRVAPKSPASKQDAKGEQLVRVEIPIDGTSASQAEMDRYMKLEDDLDAAATKAAVGSLDGNEIGMGKYTIWLYGKDATKLADVIKAALKGKGLPKGCTLYLRHGGVDDTAAKEETIPVDS